MEKHVIKKITLFVLMTIICKVTISQTEFRSLKVTPSGPIYLNGKMESRLDTLILHKIYLGAKNGFEGKNLLAYSEYNNLKTPIERGSIMAIGKKISYVIMIAPYPDDPNYLEDSTIMINFNLGLLQSVIPVFEINIKKNSFKTSIFGFYLCYEAGEAYPSKLFFIKNEDLISFLNEMEYNELVNSIFRNGE